MNKRVYQRIVLSLIAVCVLIITISLVGCSSNITYPPIAYSNSDNYKTFVTPKGDRYPMSFEYPSYYSLTYEPNTPFGTLIHLIGVPLKDFYCGKINYIDIQTMHIDTDFPDAKTQMMKQISSIKGSWYRNYRLLEKCKITTAEGIEGWEIIVTYRERPISDSSHGLPAPPAFVVYREVFFDYQGVFWRIRLFTDVESYKQDKSGFEHLLKTLEVVKYTSSN